MTHQMLQYYLNQTAVVHCFHSSVLAVCKPLCYIFCLGFSDIFNFLTGVVMSYHWKGYNDFVVFTLCDHHWNKNYVYILLGVTNLSCKWTLLKKCLMLLSAFLCSESNHSQISNNWFMITVLCYQYVSHGINSLFDDACACLAC